MKEIKVEFLNKKNNYFGVFSAGIGFCWVSAENKQLAPFETCKSYLQDQLHASINNVEGMSSLNPKGGKIDLNKTRILLAHTTQNDIFAERFESLLDFLHQVEEKMGFEPSFGEIVVNSEDYNGGKPKGPFFVINGDKRWMISTPMISLYTLLIRACLSHKKGENWKVTLDNIINGTIKTDNYCDRNYLERSYKTIIKILTIGPRPFFYKSFERNYPKTITSSNLTHCSGILGLSEGRTGPTVDYCKRWTTKYVHKVADRLLRRKGLKSAETDSFLGVPDIYKKKVKVERDANGKRIKMPVAAPVVEAFEPDRNEDFDNEGEFDEME